MQVRISQPTFADLLRTASRFVPSKTPMPILRTIYLEAFEDEDVQCLLVSATDLKTGVKVWSDKATVTEMGTCCVDAETLTAFVTALDGLAIIDLTIEKGKLVVKAREAKASFSLLDVNDFPMSGPTVTEQAFTINANRLGSLLTAAGKIAG